MATNTNVALIKYIERELLYHTGQKGDFFSSFYCLFLLFLFLQEVPRGYLVTHGMAQRRAEPARRPDMSSERLPEESARIITVIFNLNLFFPWNPGVLTDF